MRKFSVDSRIARIRRACGMTRGDLASRSGVHKGAIAAAEMGEPLNSDEAERLASALGINVGELEDESVTPDDVADQVFIDDYMAMSQNNRERMRSLAKMLGHVAHEARTQSRKELRAGSG